MSAHVSLHSPPPSYIPGLRFRYILVNHSLRPADSNARRDLNGGIVYSFSFSKLKIKIYRLLVGLYSHILRIRRM